MFGCKVILLSFLLLLCFILICFLTFFILMKNCHKKPKEKSNTEIVIMFYEIWCSLLMLNILHYLIYVLILDCTLKICPFYCWPQVILPFLGSLDLVHSEGVNHSWLPFKNITSWVNCISPFLDCYNLSEYIT